LILKNHSSQMNHSIQMNLKIHSSQRFLTNRLNR
jgi:hypothetical protein